MHRPDTAHCDEAAPISPGVLILAVDGTVSGGDDRFLRQIARGATDAVGCSLADFAPSFTDFGLLTRVWADGDTVIHDGAFHVRPGQPAPARIRLQRLAMGGDVHIMATVEPYADDGNWTVLPPDSRKYALLADNIPAMIGYWDKDLICRYANKIYVEWFRRPARTILGMHIRELLGEEVYALNRPYIEGALGGVPQSFERTLTKGDNSRGHVWAQYIPDISDGEVEGFYVLVTDITPLRESQRLLFEANTLKDTVIASTRSLIVATDLEGTVTLFNRGAELALGYAASEVVGKHTPALWHVAEEVAAYSKKISEELGVVVPPGFGTFVRKADIAGFDESEWTFVRKDGSRFLVSLMATALKNPEGNTTGYVGVITDITHRREVERLKDELISIVSHELRTPLTSIKGALDAVAQGQVAVMPPRAQPLIDMARRNADRLSKIIDDILDIDRISTGGLAIDWNVEDVLEQIFVAIDLNGAAFAANGRALVLDKETVHQSIRVDKDRLQQIIGNILSNAVKFSNPGSATTIGARRDGSHVRMWVHNEGPEIPEVFRGKIFERFSQANPTATRKQGGSGLGLHICKLLTEAMNGTIGYESGASGTTFWVEFPVLAKPHTAADRA